MQFSGAGYIVKIRNHGEKSAIITVVCPEHGKITGYVSGAQGKRLAGVCQLGNFISFNAYARVAENMLSFKGVELCRAHTADFLADVHKIEALASMCRLLDMCVAENDDLGEFYHAIDNFFTHIQTPNWLAYYSFFEFYLLDFLGIGIDVGQCAVTGKYDDLRYISPKTGRAVCAEVGAPYKDRLYAYPQYIMEHNYRPQSSEIANVLSMTGRFLSKNFLTQHNLQLPEKRANLLQTLTLSHNI